MHRYLEHMSTSFLRAVLSVCGAFALHAQAGTSILLRDDDLTATTVSVEVTRRPDGLYDYAYVVASPTTNRGRIFHFSIDLRCQRFSPKPQIAPQPPPDMLNRDESRGPMAPAVPITERAAAAHWALTRDGSVLWLLGQKPGQRRTGLHLLSPAAPIVRRWHLQPSIDGLDDDWTGVEEGDLRIPTSDDFSVTGVVEAPGCPEDAEQPSVSTLLGTDVVEELPGIDRLLIWHAPLRDRQRVTDGRQGFTFEVEYSKGLDPSSFATCPESLRTLFHPEPGRRERVTVPLPVQRNQMLFVAQGRGAPPQQPDERTISSPRDIDRFEVRRDDLPWEPRPLECSEFNTIPDELVVRPPRKLVYDGQPLVWLPDDEGEVFAPVYQSTVWYLSYHPALDTKTFRAWLDGTEITPLFAPQSSSDPDAHAELETLELPLHDGDNVLEVVAAPRAETLKGELPELRRYRTVIRYEHRGLTAPYEPWKVKGRLANPATAELYRRWRSVDPRAMQSTAEARAARAAFIVALDGDPRRAAERAPEGIALPPIVDECVHIDASHPEVLAAMNRWNELLQTKGPDDPETARADVELKRVAELRGARKDCE